MSGFNSNKMVVAQTPAPENAGERFEMEAPRFQDGGTHDANDRGYGSGIGVAQRGTFSQEPVEQPAELSAFNPGIGPQTPQPAQDFQKLYGDSENEKGQWRKTATDAMTQLEQLKAELTAMRTVTPSYPQPNAYQQPYPPAQAAQALPETFFPDKGSDDLVEVKDIDAMLRSVVAPAVMQLHTQTLELQRQQVQAMKSAVGITPDVEAKLNAECPWLQSVPDGVARIQAMQGYVRQRQAQAPQAQQASQQAQAQVSPQQAAARRVTYIESNGAARSAESEVPLQQRIAQEFGQAQGAAAKKAVLMKYGMQQANDWGSDVWGPAR